MPSAALMSRIAELARLSIGEGSHESFEKGVCVMEAVAYIAGEPHSDHPRCASPLITRLLISFNDRLKTDADRDRLLKPIIPELIGTRTTEADETTRAYMAADWLVRQRTPAWLSLAGFAADAQVLEGLARIVDEESAKAARSAAREISERVRTVRAERYEALRAKLRDATQRDASDASDASDAIAAIDASDAIAAIAAIAAIDAIDASDASAAIAASAAIDASAAIAAIAAIDAIDAIAAIAAIDAIDASAAIDAIDASAASPLTAIFTETVKIAVDTVKATKGDHATKYWAARDAISSAGIYGKLRDAFTETFNTDERLSAVRDEAARLQASFIDMVRSLCAVGRIEEVSAS